MQIKYKESKIIQVHGRKIIKKGRTEWGGKGSGNSHFLTWRLSGSIVGPRPPLDAQLNENGAQMSPTLIKNGSQMT